MTEMEVGGVTFDTEALEEMTIDQMVTVYNTISGRDPVGRFRDKATGLAALRDALEKREAQPAEEKITEVKPAEEKPAEEKAPEPQKMPHGREHRAMYEHDDLIFVMVSENPKRPGSSSATRFEKYRDGMTVQDAVDAGLKRDLAWDWDHGFITILKPEHAPKG